MFEYLKNKAKAAAGFVADKAKATYAYAAEKAQNTMEWYADMEVTPREKMITTAATIGAIGAAWAAFSLGFGSAPVTLTTLAATPAATTAITGIAAGTFMLAKKAIGSALNLGVDAIQAIAATHPDRNEGTTFGAKAYRGVARNFGQGTRFDRWFAGEYQPGAELDSDHDFEVEEEDEYTAKEGKKMMTDLARNTFGYIMPPSLFSSTAKEMEARPTEWDAKTRKQIEKFSHKTLRSGKSFCDFAEQKAIEAAEAAAAEAAARTPKTRPRRSNTKY